MIKLKDLLNEVFSLPDIVYHGSGLDFDKFDKNKSNFRGTTYFTTNKDFAKSFATDRGTDKTIIYHCKLNIDKMFDPEDINSLNALKPIIRDLIEKKYKDTVTNASFIIPSGPIYIDGNEITNPSLDDAVNWYLWRIKNGAWRILEGENILNFIRQAGYDAVLTKERGSQNIAVFDPDKVTIVKKEYI